MKYDEFVKAFNSATDAKKISLVKKHIVKEYVPYEVKVAEANEIVRRAHYKDVQGKEVFVRNSPLAYQLYIIRMIRLYTDIEWEDADVLTMFNEFEKNGIVEVMIAILGKEHETFNTVLKMVEDDDYENYRSLAGFFGTKIEAFNILLEALANVPIETEVKT